MLGALLVRLPVHRCRPLVENLQAIDPGVALPRDGVAGKNQRQGDEAPSVLRPALQNGVVKKRKIVLADDFLDRPGLHLARKKRSHLGQLRQHLQLAEHPLRSFHLQVLGDPGGDTFHRVHLERDLHLPHAGEGIDEHRDVVPLRLFKQQRRPAPFYGPVAHLGDFENWVDFGGHSLQLAVFFERLNELTKIGIGHNSFRTG